MRYFSSQPHTHTHTHTYAGALCTGKQCIILSLSLSATHGPELVCALFIIHRSTHVRKRKKEYLRKCNAGDTCHCDSTYLCMSENRIWQLESSNAACILKNFVPLIECCDRTLNGLIVLSYFECITNRKVHWKSQFYHFVLLLRAGVSCGMTEIAYFINQVVGNGIWYDFPFAHFRYWNWKFDWHCKGLRVFCSYEIRMNGGWVASERDGEREREGGVGHVSWLMWASASRDYANDSNRTHRDKTKCKPNGMHLRNYN